MTSMNMWLQERGACAVKNGQKVRSLPATEFSAKKGLQDISFGYLANLSLPMERPIGSPKQS